MEIICRIKEDATLTDNDDGAFEEVKLLAPLSIGNYLDKQLDERYISFYSKKSVYRCGSVIWIVYILDNEEPINEYFILGRDSSAQSSFKKGVYFHQDAFLLEFTKALDGVVCQSLTFTNPKNEIADIRVIPTEGDYLVTEGVSYKLLLNMSEFALVSSPVPENEMYSSISMSTINDKVKELHSNKEDNYYVSSEASYTKGNTTYYTTISLYLNEYKKDAKPYATKNAEGKTFPTNDLYLNIKLPKTTTDGKTVVKVYCRYNFFTTLHSGNSDVVYESSLLYMQVVQPVDKVKWTVSSAVNRVLALAEPLFGNEESKYYFDESDNKKYENVLLPELSLTTCTLREQLQAIASIVNAEPRARYDGKKISISFDNYGESVRADMSRYSMIDRVSTFQIDQYCTRLISFSSNSIYSANGETGKFIDPCNGFFRTLRCEVSNQRLETGNSYLYTAEKIYSIQKVELYLLTSENKYYVFDRDEKTQFPIDITPYVFENREYQLLSSYSKPGEVTKENAIYYKQGEKGIFGLFYQAPNAKDSSKSPYSISAVIASVLNKSVKEVDKVFTNSEDPYSFLRIGARVVYTPILTVTMQHGKGFFDKRDMQFQKVYNQIDNITNIAKLGENLKATVAMLGNPEEERTYLLPPSEALPNVGERLDDYAISAVKAEVFPRYTKATLALTKDFERISEHVGIDSVKRVYEVSEKNAYEREVLITSHIMIGSLKSCTPRVKLDMTALSHIFAGKEAKTQSDFVTSAYLLGMDEKKLTNDFNGIQLPVFCGAAGNSFLFVVHFADNYSAGDAAEYIDTKAEDGSKVASGYWGKSISYTDFFGRVEYLFAEFRNSETAKHEDAYSIPSFNKSSEDNSEDNSEDKKLVEIPKDNPLLIKKDSREKISLNLSFEFTTNQKDLIVGSALAEYCTLATMRPADNCYLVWLKKPIGRLTKRVKRGEHFYYDHLSVVSATVSEDENYFSIKAENNTESGKSVGGTIYGWAVIRFTSTDTINDDAEILLAKNITPTTDSVTALETDDGKSSICFYQDDE